MNVPEPVPDKNPEQQEPDPVSLAVALSPKRASRAYDRLRTAVHTFLERKGKTIGKSGKFLLLVPDVFILLTRLLRDSRVRGKDRVLLGTAIVYYLSPFDLVPVALFGPVGLLEDLVFAVFVLNRILENTDPQVLRDHWSGDGDLLPMIQRVLTAADGLVGARFLKRLRTIIK